jgi:hypothetical protein
LIDVIIVRPLMLLCRQATTAAAKLLPLTLPLMLLRCRPCGL